MTTEQAATGRTADRGSSTRAVLLAAARQVFMLEGYAEAGVTDIVALAGASVGSLYHHFSGKADLYLALFEELHNEHDTRTRRAVRECRDSGVTDPMRLLLVGARGYLDVCIEQRDLASMFARGDGPPGFEVLWRKRLSDWVHMNTEFFARSGEPLELGIDELRDQRNRFGGLESSRRQPQLKLRELSLARFSAEELPEHLADRIEGRVLEKCSRTCLDPEMRRARDLLMKTL